MHHFSIMQQLALALKEADKEGGVCTSEAWMGNIN